MTLFLGSSTRSPPEGGFFCPKRCEGFGGWVRYARPCPPSRCRGACRLDIRPPCNLCNVKNVKSFFLFIFVPRGTSLLIYLFLSFILLMERKGS